MSHFTKLNNLIQQTLPIQQKSIIYLMRHAQSLGNHSGSIVGWTDSKLSVKGRQQANQMYKGLHENIDKFNSFHSSDLSRCLQTLEIATGFQSLKVTKHWKLRQLNFGDQQGHHYDSLPEEQKKIISSLSYQPPNGQTWPIVRKRAIEYLSELGTGHHFVLAHGGLMCALAYQFGVTKVVPNCSIICVEFCEEKGDISEIKFVWEFEDIKE